MRLVSRLVLLAVLVAVPASASMTLSDSWVRVQQALAAKDKAALVESVRELKAVAHETDARRLTPYARALVAWARSHPGATGDAAVLQARELDHWLASASFLQARLEWTRGSYLKAARHYLAGWVSVFRDGLTRRRFLVSSGPWLLLSLGAALLVGIILQGLRFMPHIGHDALELGQLLFSRPNALVFAVVVLLLPLFGGLGPIWLAGWLFALSLPYVTPARRRSSVVFWLLLVAVVPALELWQAVGVRRTPIMERAAVMLEERQVDLTGLQEFADLEPHLDRSESYHLVLGALLYLHSDTLSARIEFQRAAIIADKDPRPLVFLGSLAYRDGNFPEAVQDYSSALDLDSGYILAYYDLSFAYDQAYRFREADGMRGRARRLGSDELLRKMGRAGSSTVVDPPVGREQVAQIRREVPPLEWSAAGLTPPRLEPVRWFLKPFPLSLLTTGLIGFVVYPIRKRWLWTSRSCSRCGKVFCRRCKSATESDAYCSQCISVFLKRDVVAIDAQATKLDQIRRWERRSTLARRGLAILVPGGGLVFAGQWASGIAFTFVAAVSALGLLVWLPDFVREIEPQMAVVPLQAAFIVGLAAAWLGSIVRAWNRW